MLNQLIITFDHLRQRNACSEWLNRFKRDMPNGFDIAPFFSDDPETVKMAWAVLIASDWKYQFGWAWTNGVLPQLPVFVKANLSEANLSEANLSEANLREANLSEARYNNETRFPDGFDPIAAGMVLITTEEL